MASIFLEYTLGVGFKKSFGFKYRKYGIGLFTKKTDSKTHHSNLGKVSGKTL